MLAILGLAICLVSGGYTVLSVGDGQCGGDGGSPYAAPDSPQGKLCDFLEGGASGGGKVFWVIFILVPLFLLFVGINQGLRWARGYSQGKWAVLWIAAIPVFQIVIAVALSAPSNSCGTEDAQAYEEWQARAGAIDTHNAKHPNVPRPIPPAPNECGHY
jgi:hypothetical protein